MLSMTFSTEFLLAEVVQGGKETLAYVIVSDFTSCFKEESLPTSLETFRSTFVANVYLKFEIRRVPSLR